MSQPISISTRRGKQAIKEQPESSASSSSSTSFSRPGDGSSKAPARDPTPTPTTSSSPSSSSESPYLRDRRPSLLSQSPSDPDASDPSTTGTCLQVSFVSTMVLIPRLGRSIAAAEHAVINVGTPDAPRLVRLPSIPHIEDSINLWCR